MPIEERRRIELHRHASATWGEEAADTLLELTTPAGHEPATRADLERLSDRIEFRLEQVESHLGERFERRIADAVTAQTRTLVFSQLGAIVAIAVLAFGLR